MNEHFTTSEVFILGEGQDIVLLLSAAAKWRLRGLQRDDPGLKLRLRPTIMLLQSLLRDDRAQAGLRRAWHDLGLPGSGVPLSAVGLSQRVVEAVEAGRILAIYFPRPAHVMSGTIDEAALKARVAGVEGPMPAGGAAGGDVSGWSKTQRVEEMLRRVLRGVARNLGPELARTLESLLTPQALAVMAASFVVLAALHAVGVGEVVDAGLTFYAWWTAGTAGLAALADMLTAIVHTINARSNQDLDDAAQLFTAAVAVLGVSILTLVVARAGVNRRRAKSLKPVPRMWERRVRCSVGSRATPPERIPNRQRRRRHLTAATPPSHNPRRPSVPLVRRTPTSFCIAAYTRTIRRWKQQSKELSHRAMSTEQSTLKATIWAVFRARAHSLPGHGIPRSLDHLLTARDLEELSRVFRSERRHQVRRGHGSGRLMRSAKMSFCCEEREQVPRCCRHDH
jgi:hypothetical protein